MKLQDMRLNVTTECLNNIKTLKLYSWISQFALKIQEKRDKELKIQWKRFLFGAAIVTGLYFFP